MSLTKRNSDFNVEQIHNGFLLKVNGRDDNDDWTDETVYVKDLAGLVSLIESWMELPRK